MKKILAFSLSVFFILTVSSMNSDVTVSAKCAEVQDAVENTTDVTTESWHVDGMNIGNDSAPVEQEEQIMDVIAIVKTVDETTTETVDGTADSAIPAIEAATTDVNSQNEDESADEVIPSVAAPETATEEVSEEILIEENDTPSAGIKEQGTERKAVEVKGATVIENEKVPKESIASSGKSTEKKNVVKIEEEKEVPSVAVLPQTGVVPEGCFFGVGFLICALGVCIFRNCSDTDSLFF